MKKKLITLAIVAAMSNTNASVPGNVELQLEGAAETQHKMIEPMIRVDQAAAVVESAKETELEAAKGRVRDGSKAITDKYQPEIDAAQRKYGKAKYHTDKGNNYPIETNTERTEILAPTATVRYKEIEIPTIHTKMSTTSIPVPKFGSCEIKADVPQCKVEWKNKTIGRVLGKKIKTKFPVTTCWFGRTTIPCHKGWGEVKVDLPQFKTGMTVLRVPDTIEWGQEGVGELNLPQVTVRDYPEQIEEAEKELSQAEAAIGNEIDALSAKEQMRMAQNSIRNVVVEMDAARDDLTKQKTKVTVVLNGSIAKIDAAIGKIDSARGYNKAAIRADAVSTRDALVRNRDEVLNKYDKALAKVETKRAELLAEIDGTKMQAVNDSDSSAAADS